MSLNKYKIGICIYDMESENLEEAKVMTLHEFLENEINIDNIAVFEE